MKIDRKKINMLLSMNDDRLWGTVRFFASANGIDVSKKRVTPKDIASLRRLLSSLTDDDLSRIGALVDVYKYGR